ncbi:hypothetical protein RF11_16497 [Thelohanellus kitauei]|uniref:Uncharacterized protein n=1 Tax=Thelohanellus kitauei TaxID=669202 RepID=A0A0C2N2X6_THEKT|nr:hypothetical protein RF11_16497 [Thelohanellus kitauei]
MSDTKVTIECNINDYANAININTCDLSIEIGGQRKQGYYYIKYNLVFDKSLNYIFSKYKIYIEINPDKSEYVLFNIKSLNLQFENTTEVCRMNKTENDPQINTSFDFNRIDLFFHKQYCKNFTKSQGKGALKNVESRIFSLSFITETPSTIDNQSYTPKTGLKKPGYILAMCIPPVAIFVIITAIIYWRRNSNNLRND